LNSQEVQDISISLPEILDKPAGLEIYLQKWKEF
jgi:hypothetical protein